VKKPNQQQNVVSSVITHGAEDATREMKTLSFWDVRYGEGKLKAVREGRPVVFTCSGGDADEPRHHALHGADHGRLAEEDDVEAGPGEEAGGGGDVGVEHGHGRRDVGGVGRAAVEAGPAHPQQPAARDHQQDVVRGEALPVALQPRAHLSETQKKFKSTATMAMGLKKVVSFSGAQPPHHGCQTGRGKRILLSAAGRINF
jgi:hypothetical protein